MRCKQHRSEQWVLSRLPVTLSATGRKSWEENLHCFKFSSELPTMRSELRGVCGILINWHFLKFVDFFFYSLIFEFSLVIFIITFWTSNIYWQTSCEFQTKNISSLWVRHIQSEANISSYKQSCCFTLKLTSTRAPCFPDPNVSFTSLHSVVSGFLCILTLRSLPVLQYNCSRVWFKPQAKTFQGLFYILSFSLYYRNEKIIK